MTTPPPSLFHALLRPSILQILRATGYHSTRPAVLDSLTDLAARYLLILCHSTANHAAHNHDGHGADFDIVDVRMALQDAGALLPDTVATQEEWNGNEDVRGVEEFVRWFASQRMKDLMDFGVGDGETDATDYLNALKKKHSKTHDDAKYHGTIIGRGNDVGEVHVEGGVETTIGEWITNRRGPPSESNGPDKPHDDEDMEPVPSPLSSLSSVESDAQREAAPEEKMDLS